MQNEGEARLNKPKLFLENFLIYGLGGIISKVIPLVMVPVVTRIMPSTEYFGVSDLSNTVVQFGSAMAIMGMYDAMYRLFFERDELDYKKDVCSTALAFTLVTSVIVFCVMVIFKETIARYFFGNKQYAYVVYLSAMATLVGATNSIISAPTRMQNKRKIFLITNTLSPLISYSVAIPMLLAGHYVIALPLAAVISGSTMELAFGVLNRKWFDLKRFNSELLKQLLVVAIPLLPNFLIYWIFNSCDKVMITNMIGIGAAGIYSVGSKLGHASQLIYVAFAGGWQYFAFSTMKDKNQVESNSKVFEYLGVMSFAATTVICAWSYTIFKLLFTKDYLEGFIIAPYLFLAPLLQMLFQVAANQFLVVKKTWPNMFILSIGALLNVLINYFLIPVLGIEGASLATLTGYIVSDILCVYVLCRMDLMVVSGKFMLSVILMVAYFIAWRLFYNTSFVIGSIIALVLILIYIYMFRTELIVLFEKLFKKNQS